MVFDVIVVTASTELQRVVYQHEMETRKQNGVDKLGITVYRGMQWLYTIRNVLIK